MWGDVFAGDSGGKPHARGGWGIGVLYMQDLMTEFNGNYTEALAAYNTGPGNERKALAKGGDWLSTLSAETQKYVANITGSQQVASAGVPLSSNVQALLTNLRATQSKGNTTTIHAPVTVNGAQNPAATGRAVSTALNSLAIQSGRGLA